MINFPQILSGHYINGKWSSSAGESFISTNPADNHSIWEGHHARLEDIHEAMDAAQAARHIWASFNFCKRAEYVLKFAEIVKKRRAELKYLISMETGKPLWESDTEVSSVIAKAALSLKACQERTSDTQVETGEVSSAIHYKPHGITAVFGAYNFPAHLSNGHIMPALLAGNTVIYKPSELAPAVAAFIMQCWHESGIPKGVLQCLQGGAKTGKLLLTCDLQGVYFTGSYATGQKIHKFFAGRPEVILALEMGGNNALVIKDPEDISAAVYNTILSAFITAGQRCSSARRVIIADNSRGDLFLSRLLEATKKIRTGAFTETPEPFMGPVINPEFAARHLDAQENLANSGGKILLPMLSLKPEHAFLTPGIIDMTEVSIPPDEEIFAPLIQIHRYLDFDEAIQKANDSRYGLVAGLIGGTPRDFKHFFQNVHCGLVNWNRPTTGASGSLPFGGMGLSGNHRPSAFFAADYCAIPVASLESQHPTMPETLLPGLEI